MNRCRSQRAPLTAGAATITFEQFTQFTDVGSQIPGLTFTNALVLTAGTSLNDLEFPPHSRTDVIFDSAPGITVTFDSPISAFSVYVTYVVPVTLSAYDAGNNLLGTVTSLYLANYASSGLGAPNELFQIAAPGISYVTLMGDPQFGGSFVADDLTYTADAVPEPASLTLLGIGLAGLGARRWRQRKQ